MIWFIPTFVILDSTSDALRSRIILAYVVSNEIMSQSTALFANSTIIRTWTSFPFPGSLNVDFASGMYEPQSSAGVDSDGVLLVVNPDHALPVVDDGDIIIHVVRERLVAHPRDTESDVLDWRYGEEVHREHDGVEEGERPANVVDELLSACCMRNARS